MRRPTWRIGTRLFVAQGVVLLATIATAGLIAGVVGPSVFHEHMLRADHPPDPSERMHVEEAYQVASVISLSIALAAAVVIALVVSWYLTRRFQRPLLDVTRAAAAVSEGDYGARVPLGDGGPELDSLAEAFNRMAAQLAHTEDTRRRLLSDLAHELRTPTATLAAYLEGVEDGVMPWNETTRAVLADQVDRLTRLAADIDAVSRAEEGRLQLQLTTVSITDLVTAATTAQSDAYAAKNVHLLVDSDKDATILADRTRLLQVLTNLLDNARRHTPSGDTVTIGWHASNGQLVLTVSDTGEGIPSEQLPHIFERFYRGDTARNHEQQGSGIGLTISRAIIEAHGGRISAESLGAGGGATFTVSLMQ